MVKKGYVLWTTILVLVFSPTISCLPSLLPVLIILFVVIYPLEIDPCWIRILKRKICHTQQINCDGLKVELSPGGSVVKNLHASAGDARDLGSIPGWGRSPRGGYGNPLQYILAWRIPWIEEPGGLHSVKSQRVRHDWACTHTQR